METRDTLMQRLDSHKETKEAIFDNLDRIRARTEYQDKLIQQYSRNIEGATTAEEKEKWTAQLNSSEEKRRNLKNEYEIAQRDLKIQEEAITALVNQIQQTERPTDTVKTPAATNESESDKQTEEKYENSTVVSNTAPQDEATPAAEAQPTAEQATPEQSDAKAMSVDSFMSIGQIPPAFSPRVPPKTEQPKITPAYPTVNQTVDRRVRIKVPSSYLIGQTTGPNNELTKNSGIVFPYTPDIKIENSANYSAVNVTHSNYTQYFYKNSSAGEIVITGKFTVQNETEAGIFLATVHLLRALTKMKFSDDQNAGAPPPVCRLFAYGNYVYDNTPVAVKQVSIQLPQDVDYIDAGKVAKFYGNSMAPTVSTITVGLIPIYSRKEMLEASVTGWLTKDQRSRGFI